MITFQTCALVACLALLMKYWPKLEEYYWRHGYPSRPSSPKPPGQQRWSSPISSWFQRALLTPHPNPHQFIPFADTIILQAQYSAMGGHGLTVALFSMSDSSLPPKERGSGTGGSVAVDGIGRVLLVSAKDTEHILSLVDKVRELPENPHGWDLKQEESCLTLNTIYLPPLSHAAVLLNDVVRSPLRGYTTMISITGFGKRTKELARPTVGFTEMPDALWELMGLILNEVKWPVDAPPDERVLETMNELLSTSSCKRIG